MAAKHNWEAISREYIEAPEEASRPTLEELARKHNVSFGYIQQKAAKDRWTEQAKIFLRTVEEERRKQKSTSLASEQAQFDSDCLKIGRAVMQQLAHHLRAQKKDEPMKIYELDLLMRAMERVQKVGKVALGEAGGDEEATENVVIYLPENSRDKE